MTFMSVVLPEPLGPMSPSTLPRSTSNVTASSAHRPPNRIPTLSIRIAISAMRSGLVRGQRGEPGANAAAHPEEPDEPAREEPDHEDDHPAEEQRVRVHEVAPQQPRGPGKDQR